MENKSEHELLNHADNESDSKKRKPESVLIDIANINMSMLFKYYLC